MFDISALLGGGGSSPWLPWQPVPGPVPTPPMNDPWLGPPQGAAPPAGNIPGGMLPPTIGPGPAEAGAAHMAKLGIPPGAVFPAASAGFGGSLGAMLNPAPGVGGEVARDAEATTLPPSAQPASGTAPTTAPKNPFAGLSMPQAPEAQRISSPAAPRPTGQIKQGELLALLQSLSGNVPKQLNLASAIGRL